MAVLGAFLLAALAAPYGLEPVELSTNAFRATWRYDGVADGFRLDVWRETWVPWRGDVLWTETFAACTNATGNPKALSPETIDRHTDHQGWRGDVLYIPVGAEGIIQINKTDGIGWLVSPPLPPLEDVALVVRACAVASQPDHTMPVYLIRGDATNELARFELTTAFEDYVQTIPALETGDRFAFKAFSVGKKRRVWMDAVHLVAQFAPACCATDAVCTARPCDGAAREAWVDGLEAGAMYGFAVSAVVDGEVARSADCPVALLAADGEGAATSLLDAVALSGLPREGARRRWHEDFSVFTNVFATSGNVADWMNGVTVPYWQAYVGTEAATAFRRNQGAGTTSGYYAYWAGGNPSTYSFGPLTKADAPDFVFGVAFENDTDAPARNVTVRYDARQFGFRNKDEQTMAFEFLVTNRLVSVSATGAWRACDALSCRTARTADDGLSGGQDPPVTTPLPDVALGEPVPPANFLLLRWRRSAVANAAALAIDNRAVSFEVKRHPAAIVFR